MIHNPNALIVPALPSEFRAGDEVTHIARILQDNNIQPVSLFRPSSDRGFIPTVTEYRGDMSPASRQVMTQFAEAQRGLIAEADIVVIANALTEPVVDKLGGKPVCRVPFGIGRVAINMIRVANEVYGLNSGRVFLSQGYPDLTELFSLNSTSNAVVRARARLLGIYPLRPVALQGKYERMIEMTKTPRTPKK